MDRESIIGTFRLAPLPHVMQASNEMPLIIANGHSSVYLTTTNGIFDVILAGSTCNFQYVLIIIKIPDKNVLESGIV